MGLTSRSGRAGLLVLVMGLAVAGCTFNPDVDVEAIRCTAGDDDGCPSGFTCSTQYLGLCCRGSSGQCDEAPPALRVDGAADRGVGTGDGASDRDGREVTGDASAPSDLAGADGFVDVAGNDGAVDGLADGGADGPICPTPCTPGDQRCGTGGGVETCVLASGCTVWGAESPCGPRARCAPSPARCACDAPPAGCTAASGSYCSDAMTLETCVADSSNCIYKEAPRSCPAGKPCAGPYGAASCSCAAPPAVCQNVMGTVCDGTGRVARCGFDANLCLAVASTETCVGGQQCAGLPGSAACKCPADPPECLGVRSGTVCRGETVVTCTTSAQGCVSASVTKTCTAAKPCGGTAGAADCQCPAPPAGCASGAGRTCSGTSVVACSQDPVTGCYVAATSACPTGRPCAGGFPAATCTCPATTCPAEGSACSGNTLTTCTRDATSGCLQSATMTCGANRYCAGAAPTASCQAPSPVGFYDDLGGASAKSAGYLSGQAITLAAASTIRGFGVISRQATNSVSMGLYTSVGGNPSTLVARAEYQPIVVNGRNEFAATIPAGGTRDLPAGTYWLMVMYDATTTVAGAVVGSTLVDRRVVAAGWADLPPMLSGVSAQNGQPATNYYILVTP